MSLSFEYLLNDLRLFLDQKKPIKIWKKNLFFWKGGTECQCCRRSLKMVRLKIDVCINYEWLCLDNLGSNVHFWGEIFTNSIMKFTRCESKRFKFLVLIAFSIQLHYTKVKVAHSKRSKSNKFFCPTSYQTQIKNWKWKWSKC